MNKRIFKGLLIISLVTLVLSIISSLVLYYNFYKVDSHRELSNFLEIVDGAVEENPNPMKYLERIEGVDKTIRYTYISPDGTVLFDSIVEPSTMSNHSDRPEFIGAKKFKTYENLRRSETRSKDTYYIAREMENGNVLRISKESDNVLGAILKMIPIYIFIGAFISLLAILLSRYSTKKILEPLDNYTGEDDSVDLVKIPELVPFLKEITTHKNTIANHLVEIKKERDTITTILENMKEGLIIVNSNRTVLMINKEAVYQLDSTVDAIGKNILYVSRREELVNALEDCYAGKSSKGVIEVKNRKIKYYANPVYYESVITGAILLLIDETERLMAEKIREEFSANVSHELKTPLTSISGFAELLKNGMVDSAEDKLDFVDRIYDESRRLLMLIDEIIKISKLEDGSEVKKELVNLSTMGEKILKHFGKIAEDKNIKLEVSGEATLMANGTMMWELLSNLVDNAIKYNTEFGKVDVKFEELKDSVNIIVEDDGIGIAPEDVDRIFERFYRVEKSRNKKRGGTGLGLSIVKHIVKNHNGKVKVDSELEKGTKISINIPK